MSAEMRDRLGELAVFRQPIRSHTLTMQSPPWTSLLVKIDLVD